MAVSRVNGKAEDNVLGDFAEGTAFLAEVDDKSDAPTLCCADALFDGVDEVGFAGADVGAEDVGAVAFVVDAEGEFFGFVGEVGGVSD